MSGGFTRFCEACARHRIDVQLAPPPYAAPSRELFGATVEPTLREIQRTHAGAFFLAPDFYLHVFPVEGDVTFEHHNRALRRSSTDHVPPYPFEGLHVFAQLGRQASYLATVPGLVDAGGRQPVLYVDDHETPWALPLATSVDATFAVLAEFLDVRESDRTFPWDCSLLIGGDPGLRALVRSGALDPWIRGDRSIHRWIASTFTD